MPGPPAPPAHPSQPLRIGVVLPGMHRVQRGAEVAFEAIATRLAAREGHRVTVFGSGPPRDRPYAYRRIPCIDRRRFRHLPSLPVLRSEYAWEDLTFTPGLLWHYRPAHFDVTLTCSYPFCNWLLTRRGGTRRPAHVYVTQNGDWPPRRTNAEYRWFDCDGLVCTNPEYHARHRDHWPCALVPNGVDPDTFAPRPDARRSDFGLTADGPLVLMVSALVPGKRVPAGIDACAALGGTTTLAVAGDGPQAAAVLRHGRERLGPRFHLLDLPRERMPALYSIADAFLHMSLDEPSANAYVEALACGLPVVTHDREVTRWTLDRHGILVDTGDPARVTAALRRAFAERTPARTDAQRRFVRERFSWDTLATAYSAFLGEVAAGRDAQP